MKSLRKRLLSAVVAMMLVCSVLPVNMLAAEEEAAAEPAAVETTTPEPKEPTAVIDNNDLADSVVSTPAEEPTVEESAEEETIAEETPEEEATEPTEETTEPVEEISEEESVEANLVDEEAPKTDETEADKEQTGTTEDTRDWDEGSVSKSKTATNLDENFETKVTLSLPSAQETLTTDVVFVLDKSESSPAREQAADMLKSLKEQLEKLKSESNGKDAKINVGIVIFDKEAHTYDLMDLEEKYDDILEILTNPLKVSGTNTHTGILAGTKMLDESKTDDNRKYLVFVSDGITYLYDNPTDENDENPTKSISTGNLGNSSYGVGSLAWQTKYGDNTPPEDWAEYLNEIGKLVEADGTKYEAPYNLVYNEETGKWERPQEIIDGLNKVAVPADQRENHAISVDKALYLTYQAYMAAAAKYNCYAVLNPGASNDTFPWGPSFMAYLANQKESKGGGDDVTEAFTSIKNDIYYLLDTNSKVVDIIGSGKDNKGNDYDFDFIDDAKKLLMKVGSKEYEATKIPGTNKYGFAWDDEKNQYTYVLEYVQKDENGKETLVWNIYAPVSNFEPVSLTYALKLVNPQTTAGTYGEYDADGSKKLDGLYTNESATLYPYDSDGKAGDPDEFNKPTVSYTVKEQTTTPTTPGNTDETPTKPDDQTPTTPPTEEPSEEPGTTVDPEPTEPDIEEPIDEEPTEDPVDEEPSEEPEETDNDTAAETNNDSGLPQTGQDWMMVSVLLIAGVAILVVGFTMKRRKVED